MRYKLSKEALNDLEQIWVYTLKKWSIQQADRYFGLIMNEIEYLSINPNHGKDYSHLRSGYFGSRIKSHLIFYKTNEEAGEIEIIRILHQRMDIDSRLDK